MYIISISYKTAPLSIREIVSFTSEEQEIFIRQVLNEEHVKECAILSTCNRSEIYFQGDGQAVTILQQQLADFKQAKLEELMKYFHIYCGENAIRHLFQVTCGFDSMVIGEDEILGQVKEAYDRALTLSATGYYLNTLFQSAITCAKKIKTDTRLSKIPISVGTLTVNEILKFSGENKKVLIIGITGKMGTIITKNLYKKSGISVIGTSRSHNSLRQFDMEDQNVKVINYSDRYQYVDDADIIISATTSPHYTITFLELSQVLHNEKERLFIDLSVPIDIDKEITRLNGVKLIDIDNFNEISKNNLQLKEKESLRAQAIIEEQLEELLKELSFHDFLPEISSLKQAWNNQSIESILYGMKAKSTSAELAAVLQVLRKMME